MSDLLIPFAVVVVDYAEKLIVPAQAQKGQELKCPECSNVVILRKASRDESWAIVRRSHFAHLSESNNSGCSGGTGEGHVHKTAKSLVVQAIQEWMAGDGPRPCFIYKCSCGNTLCRFMPFRPMVVHAEHPLDSGLVPDVFVDGDADRLDDDRHEMGAIEIVKSHRVSEEKAASYSQDLSWWIEVEADPVLEEPSRWVVTRSSFEREDLCPYCIDARLSGLRRQEVNLKTNIASLNDTVLDLHERHADLERQIGAARIDLTKETAACLSARLKLDTARQQLLDIESGIVSARKRDDVESLDELLVTRRSERYDVERRIEELKAREREIRIGVEREPEGVRWEFFWNCLQEARLAGYRPGYPAAKHKEKYNAWPPQTWSDRARFEFVSDTDWQSRVARRSPA